MTCVYLFKIAMQKLSAVLLDDKVGSGGGSIDAAEASFQHFLGGQLFFFIYQCHQTLEKLEKSTLYVVI